jgi:hypothetical protein
LIEKALQLAKVKRYKDQYHSSKEKKVPVPKERKKRVQGEWGGWREEVSRAH